VVLHSIHEGLTGQDFNYVVAHPTLGRCIGFGNAEETDEGA
jgi:hypothetical protein